jgi:hypothetical protein
MSTTPSLPQTPGGGAPVPPQQKSSGNKVLFWILGIVLGFVVIGFIGIVGLGYYAMHRAKQAGFDSELMKKNPALAAAKMAVSLNRDVEIVSSDDDAGTMVVRDKKTGKVVTMKFDPQKKSMVITDENGKTMSMTTTGEGSTGGLEVKSSEGTVKYGGTAEKAPDWVPQYPGSSPQSTFSSSTAEGQSGSFMFTTSDSAEKVISFYSDSLKSSGFAVTNMVNHSEGKAGGMISGEDKATKRTVVVILGTETDGLHVNVNFTAKQ